MAQATRRLLFGGFVTIGMLIAITRTTNLSPGKTTVWNSKAASRLEETSAPTVGAFEADCASNRPIASHTLGSEKSRIADDNRDNYPETDTFPSFRSHLRFAIEEVWHWEIMLSPARAARPYFCDEDPSSSNRDDDFNTNGLKRFGIELNSQTDDRPRLPSSMSAFKPAPIVNCPIHMDWSRFGFPRYYSPPSKKRNLIWDFVREPVFLDQSHSLVYEETSKIPQFKFGME